MADRRCDVICDEEGDFAQPLCGEDGVTYGNIFPPFIYICFSFIREHAYQTIEFLTSSLISKTISIEYLRQVTHSSICWYLHVLPVLHKPEVVDICVNIM